uniref:Uncharacterized protein n=1 Tax=Marseillevirus LCMAC202 TaxID=2506606 RepID=A0A481YYV5_9VIRU|nr:MAG: hypothetical protein LCMAC202_03770 [Marseillevirus LCMAC202]
MKIGEHEYDLDLAQRILLSKTMTMTSMGEYVYFLAFPKEGEHEFSNSVKINEMEDKEEIYSKIKEYLEVNPHKWIQFDGCCFH